MRFLRWIRWLVAGRPVVNYTGANCGCCGRWYSEDFSVPAYLADPWLDTWGLCSLCKQGLSSAVQAAYEEAGDEGRR